MHSKWDTQLVVVGPRGKAPEGFSVIDTTSRGGWAAELSPFNLGPCALYGDHIAQNMEAGWQFAKLYREFADDHGQPLPSYWQWAQSGWACSDWPNKMDLRYPVGKGRKPLCTLWQGEHLAYVEARKFVYAPLYRDAVRQTDGYATLKLRYDKGERLALWDFDAYPEADLGRVLHDSHRKMGHAFVLAMMLTLGDSVDFMTDPRLIAPPPEADLFNQPG
jgi:hypothetical protein